MKSFLIMILIPFSNFAFGQIDNFQDLLKMYDGNRNEIDSIIAKKYFGLEFNEHMYKAYTDKLIIQKPFFIGISYYMPCGAGGICESSILRTFNYSGKVIDEIVFESEFADCTFDDDRSCTLISDTLLVFLNQKTTSDCNEDSILTNKVSVEFIQVSDSGKFLKENEINIDTRRDYYYTSSDLLTDQFLKDKTKEELAVMRNEIFAAHGYIFKTNKWQLYFRNKIWYTPRFEDVNDNLTFIEKKNIESILRHENN